jgi:hypothetical protein
MLTSPAQSLGLGLATPPLHALQAAILVFAGTSPGDLAMR